MAQSNEPEPQPQPRPYPHLEKPFSLVPSIFTSFSALPNEPQPTAPEEKITRILQNLDSQHKAVRRNMIGLLQERGRSLVRRAEEELADLEGDSDDYDEKIEREEARKRREESRQSREEMLKRVRVKAREGAKAEDYEVNPGSLEFRGAPLDVTGHGDVEMSGMGSSRSAATIRQELSLQLRDLVDRGVAELEAYDNHAAESTNMYKQALKRREERRGSTSTSAVQSPIATSAGGLGGGGFGGGILRNGHEQSLVDATAIRRMSTGVPTVGAAPVQPVRAFESVEEVARRASTSK